MIARRLRLGLAMSAMGLAVLAGTGAAQNERASAEATIGGARVAIDYGRPSLRGRDVLEALPPGMLWRLGADQATTLTTEGTLVFPGSRVGPGAYSLFLRRVGETTFRLVINARTGQWGSQYDPDLDVATVPLVLARLDDEVERLEIVLDERDPHGGTLALRWGKVALSTAFEMR